jgi:hypothetical protein
MILLKDAVLTWDDGGSVRVNRKSDNDILLGKWLYWPSPKDGETANDWLIVALVDAISCMARDGCNPREVHAQMLKIKEYADVSPLDNGGTCGRS